MLLSERIAAKRRRGMSDILAMKRQSDSKAEHR